MERSREFDELLSNEIGIIKKWVMGKGYNYNVANEIMQETALTALTHYTTYNWNCRMLTWLTGIAKIKLKQQKKEEGEPLYHESISEQPNLYDFETIEDALNNSLSSLSPNDGIYVNEFINGWRQKEIAEKYNTTEETVKSRIHKSKNKIRKQLAPYIHKEEIIKEPMPVRIDRYIHLMKERFRYTNQLFYDEIYVSKLCKKSGITTTLAWIVNHHILEHDGHRVFKLKSSPIFVDDIYNEFKTWDRDYHRIHHKRKHKQY